MNGWAWTGLGLGLIVAAGACLVAQVKGSGEIARGELVRYFAEKVWYPLWSQSVCRR